MPGDIFIESTDSPPTEKKIQDSMEFVSTLYDEAYGDFIKALVENVLSPQIPHVNAKGYLHIAKVFVALVPGFENSIYSDGDKVWFDKSLAEFIALHIKTAYKCGQSVDVALTYLKFNYDDNLEYYRLKLEWGARHFLDEDHVMGVLYNSIVSKWYAFSPANAFNIIARNETHADEILYLSNLNKISKPELYPSYNGKKINRLRDIIVADSYEDLLSTIDQIEGGNNTYQKWIRTKFEINPNFEIYTKHPGLATSTETSFNGNHPFFNTKSINVLEYIKNNSKPRIT